eukprot:1159355-Pelagomonas_calceolata.AAC.9
MGRKVKGPDLKNQNIKFAKECVTAVVPQPAYSISQSELQLCAEAPGHPPKIKGVHGQSKPHDLACSECSIAKATQSIIWQLAAWTDFSIRPYRARPKEKSKATNVKHGKQGEPHERRQGRKPFGNLTCEHLGKDSPQQCSNGSARAQKPVR